jgi:polar amino acid transport system permease protein
MSTIVRPAPLDSAPPTQLRSATVERDAWFYVNIGLSAVGLLLVAGLLFSVVNPSPLYRFWLRTFHHPLPFNIPYFRYFFTLPQAWRGVRYTFILAILSQTTGIILGLLAALSRTSRIALLRGLSWLYIWVFRGTPVLLQIYLVANALPLLLLSMDTDPTGHGWVGRLAVLIGSNAFASGYLALGLNEGAYMSEIVRAGIESIDRGQMEAAKALGMTYPQAMRRIILPQALKVIIPPTGNEFISMLKTTSLVSVIGLQELMLISLQTAAHSFNFLEVFTAAGIYYLAMTTVLTLVQSQIERRLGERRAEIRRSPFDNLRRLFLGSGPPPPAVAAAVLPPKETR